MSLERPNAIAKRGPGRPPGQVGIADRLKRLQMAHQAAAYTDRIIALWGQVLEDENAPLQYRLICADRLMDRGYGKPAVAVETTQEGTTKHVYQVRWLPPDPNDRSNYIEPEPDR
jgi:hypothetical protein